MNDHTFTFAELEFLAGDEPSWPDVRALLSIGSSGDAVAAAGASSLVMRGLAQATAGGFNVRTDVRAHVALLFRPSRVITITRGDATGLNLALALLPASGAPTCLVSLGGPGVYEVSVLKPSEDPGAQLRDVILALAREGRTALTIGPKDAPGELLISHDSGTWTLGRTADERSAQGTSDDESAVAASLEAWLRTWLAG